MSSGHIFSDNDVDAESTTDCLSQPAGPSDSAAPSCCAAPDIANPSAAGGFVTVDEPRITLSAGVMVKVTRWKKHWLGRKCRWRSRRGPWGGWGAGFLGSVLWRRWSMRTDACWGRAGQEEGQVDENMIKGKQLGHIRIPKVSCKVYSCKIYCILFIQFINISARRQCNSNYYIFIEASLNSNWHPEEAYSWGVWGGGGVCMSGS